MFLGKTENFSARKYNVFFEWKKWARKNDVLLPRNEAARKDLGVLFPCIAQLENIHLFFKSGYNKKNECLARKPYSVLLKKINLPS